LKSLLVGAARPLPGDRITMQGAGLIDLGGAAAAELAAVPSSLAFGRAVGRRWRTEEIFELRNVSVRRLDASLEVHVEREGAAAVEFDVRPKRVTLRAGRTVRVRVRARVASSIDGAAPTEGYVVVTPLAGREIRVPWTIVFGSRVPPSLSAVRLSMRSFVPSDAAPSQLSFVAGALRQTAGAPEVLPLSRLDLELWSPEGGRIGLLARLRNVLPGRYSFGVTGRDPTGALLPDGDYQLRLLAFGTEPGGPTVRTVRFQIK
jgi:predicted RNA-binding protein with TRAM domain